MNRSISRLGPPRLTSLIGLPAFGEIADCRVKVDAQKVPRASGSLRFVGIAIGITMLTFGCGQTPPEYLVSGQVLVSGKPTGGVYVLLHEAQTSDPMAAASARTSDDGSFIAQVPASGRYSVTVFWPKVTQDDGDIIEGPDQLGGRYRDPAHPVLDVEIQEGDNLVPPIELKRR